MNLKPNDKVQWIASGHSTTQYGRTKVKGTVLWIEGDRARVQVDSNYQSKVRCWKKLDQLEVRDASGSSEREEASGKAAS